METPALLLEGSVQPYDWGGTSFLAKLLRKPAMEGAVWAEVWLGAHPKGPAQTVLGPLDQLLQTRPTEWLGAEIADKYQQNLPFLFKVLDVAAMLSIQAHPSKAAALAGYEREEAAGIPFTAAHRNYRDCNHKPELGVALSDFYLLHGFKSPEAIAETLMRFPSWHSLLPILRDAGLKGLYSHVMQLPQAAVDSLLKPLAQSLAAQAVNNRLEADYWAKQAFGQYSQDGHHDRGIFSIYWLNLVKLRPGEGIFQAAGVPHAYLSGACIELMANSDNVLRGGLTPKHVDVPELLQNLRFEAVHPQILQAHIKGDTWRSYDCPVADFALSVAEVQAGESLKEGSGPAIYLVLEGHILLASREGKTDKNQEITAGQAFFLPFGRLLSITALQTSTIYRASVNQSAI